MEIELKLLLSGADSALALLATLGEASPPVHQHNLYFDGRQREWGRRGVAVRLRREDDRLLLTVKTEGAQRGEFVARGEWERELPPGDWSRLRGGGEPLLSAVSEMLPPVEDCGLPVDLLAVPLIPVGAMDNLRRRAVLPGDGPSLAVEIDETTYPNGQQLYEAELEVGPDDDAAAAQERLRRCFAAAGLPWLPSVESKRARLERVLAGGRA